MTFCDLKIVFKGGFARPKMNLIDICSEIFLFYWNNLNEETMKCKKDLAFSTSKNSVNMSSFSTKENTNVEGKSKNENGI